MTEAVLQTDLSDYPVRRGPFVTFAIWVPNYFWWVRIASALSTGCYRPGFLTKGVS